jgi:hypothetical protein
MRRLRYKVVRGKCPDHVPDTLGEYDPNTSTIRLYVDNIRRRAKVWYCSYADLKQMVMLHEESHAKTDHLNLPTTQDELVADSYAFYRFKEKNGRWPDVDSKYWFERKYV